MKCPVFLYWCDSLELVEYLFHGLLFAHMMDLIPYWLYKTAEWLCCVYTEWMLGNDAWEMQVS